MRNLVAAVTTGELRQASGISGISGPVNEAPLRSGALEVQGSETLRRALPRWFTLSPFAAVPRPASLQLSSSANATMMPSGPRT